MKKIFGYAFAILAGTILLVGCETENEHAIYKGEDGVAFAAASLAPVEVTTADNTIEVPISRGNAEGSLTVSLKLDRPANATYPADIVTIPADVTFEPGQYTATIPVETKISSMTPGVKYTFPITASNPSVGSIKWDATSTPIMSTTVNIQCTTPPAWNPQIKIAKYTPGAYNTVWGINPPTVLYVKYQKADGSEFYRLVDAYQPETEYEGFTLGTPDILPSEMLSTNNYLVINALNPNNVIIDAQKLGVDWGYGNMAISGTRGVMKDNVLTITNSFNIGDGRGASGTDIIDFNIQTP